MFFPYVSVKLYSNIQSKHVYNQILNISLKKRKMSYNNCQPTNLHKSTIYNLSAMNNKKCTFQLKTTKFYKPNCIKPNSIFYNNNILYRSKTVRDCYIFQSLFWDPNEIFQNYFRKFFLKNKFNLYLFNTYTTDCNRSLSLLKREPCRTPNLIIRSTSKVNDPKTCGPCQINPWIKSNPWQETSSTTPEIQEILSFKICPVLHSNHATAISFWQGMSYFSLVAIIIYASILYPKVQEHEKHPRPEFVPWHYMYKRSTPFPWGDGKHSMIHNPVKNALPDGYEVEDPNAEIQNKAGNKHEVIENDEE